MKKSEKNNRFFSRVTVEQCRDAGMALELICLLTYIWLPDRRILAAAVILLLVNMVLPLCFQPFAVVWFGFSRIMGAVMSRVLLTLVFFIVVTPVAIIRRLLGIDSLGLKQWKRGCGSVFTICDHAYTAKDIEHPF